MNRITHYRYFTLQIYKLLTFNCLLNRKIVMKFRPLYLIMQVWKLASNLFPTRCNRAGAGEIQPIVF